METLSGPPFVHPIFLAMKIYKFNFDILITGGTKNLCSARKIYIKIGIQRSHRYNSTTTSLAAKWGLKIQGY